MAKFNFKIEKYDGFRKVDEFTKQVAANERLDAWAIICDTFPSKLGFYVTLLEIE